MKWTRRKKNAVTGMTIRISIKRYGSLDGLDETVNRVVEALGKFSPYVEINIKV